MKVDQECIILQIPAAKPYIQYTVPIGNYTEAFIMYLQFHKKFPMTQTKCMAYWLTDCLGLRQNTDPLLTHLTDTPSTIHWKL